MVSRCFSEIQDLTPEQATAAKENVTFNRKKPWVGPDHKPTSSSEADQVYNEIHGEQISC